MNKTDLSIAIAADTGLFKTPIFDMITAITVQLEAQGVAGRAVVWDGFGTFFPRQKVGLRTGRIFGGATITYDNWKLVPHPERLDELGFIERVAAYAQTKPDVVSLVLQSYKLQVLRALRRGASVHNHGNGTFKVARQRTRVYHHADGSVSSKVPAKLVVVYRAGQGGLHQKFVPVVGLI